MCSKIWEGMMVMVTTFAADVKMSAIWESCKTVLIDVKVLLCMENNCPTRENLQSRNLFKSKTEKVKEITVVFSISIHVLTIKDLLSSLSDKSDNSAAVTICLPFANY